MVSLPLAVFLAVSSVGDTVLVDFRADYCAPCRQMDPVVAQLASRGYAVQRCDVDKDPQTASRFNVTSIPCFVMIVDGHEVDRVVGPTEIARLEGMFRKAQARAVAKAPPTANSSSPSRGPSITPVSLNASASTASRELVEHLLAASVRIRIGDTGGNSVGSGTIIDARDGQALVLTCGHVFRDSQGKGRIQVDLFGENPQTVTGKLIAYDDKRDTGLISIPLTGKVEVAPVAPVGQSVRKGDRVVNIGCNHGADATALESRITSINRYSGPANLQVAGEPVQGRSGGGLFNLQGQVIGVCNAADKTDNEGLYAALDTIYAQLDSSKLTFVYRPETNNRNALPVVRVDHTPTSPLKSALVPTAVREQAAPPADVFAGRPATNSIAVPAGAVPPATARAAAPTAAAPAAPASAAQLSRQEQATLSEIAKHSGSEIIVIVRQPNDPTGKSEVFMLDQASPAFLNQLGAAQRPAVETARAVASDAGSRLPASMPAAFPR